MGANARVMEMVGLEKTYRENRETVLNAISDMMELQKGKIVFSDTAHGRIGYRTKLYGVPYEFHLTVSADDGKCRVRIETEGGRGDPEKRVEQLFMLLGSMLG